MTRATAITILAFAAGTAAFAFLLVHVIRHPGLGLYDIGGLAASCLLVVGSVIAAMRRKPPAAQVTRVEIYEMGYTEADKR
ncbi:hypothetical protein [Microbispora bryophytorum]|uniref:hypothetical protein n=1 Tax=Microbispora bryophytorum TaxID=1460882 RepID=UPI0033C9CD45